MKINKQSLLPSNKVKILLFLILVLAGVLRLWKLTEFPAGLNADEAAIGYNAYSLLQTGRDEHGEFFPIHFKSFGDYKPGFYFYLVLPFVKVLGLNIWAVRLPSAILGIFTVLSVYLLVKELFPKENQFFIGEIAALMLTISPWHLHFSRGGWEVNTATSFIVFATLFFLKGLKSSKYFSLSVVFYALSLYTYHSARVIVPFLGLGLVWFYRQKLLSQSREVLLNGILGIIFLIPLILSFFSPAGFSRFSGVGFLSETGPFWRVNELRGEHKKWNAPAVVILHNKFIGYGFSFLENYFDHFRGEFLFLSGDVIERNRVPETGQMYLIDVLFLLLGVYFLFKNMSQGGKVVFLWLAVAPLAAAMTFQTPHALRAHNMVIPLTIISASGLYMFLKWVKERRKPIAILLYCYIAILLVWSVTRYLHQYYVHYPKAYPAAWEYGFKELVEFVKPLEKSYDKIFVTDKYDQPYILFLFYLKYSPWEFQKEVVLTPRDQFGFSTVRDFGKYHFEKINWDEVSEEKNALVIGTEEEIPSGAEIIKTIYFPNSKPAFRIAKT